MYESSESDGGETGDVSLGFDPGHDSDSSARLDIPEEDPDASLAIDEAGDVSARLGPGHDSDSSMGLDIPEEDPEASLALDKAGDVNTRLGPGHDNDSSMGLDIPAACPSENTCMHLASDSESHEISEGESEICELNCTNCEDDRATWQVTILEVLEEHLGPQVVRSSFLFTAIVLSTTFSGIGCAEMAGLMLMEAASTIFGRPLPWVLAASCEILPGKVAKLQKLVKGNHCIFQDIADTCTTWHSSCATSTYEEQRKQIARAKFVDRRQRHCARHDGLCTFPSVHGEIAGSPCTPWSRIGSRLGRAHKLTHLLIIWCYWLRAMQTPLAIHENVVGFDIKILEEILQDLYYIVHIHVNPAMAGELVRRARIYSILLLRSKVKCVADIVATYAVVEKKLAGRMPAKLEDALIANANDLLFAENEARKRLGLPSLNAHSGDWAHRQTENVFEEV